MRRVFLNLAVAVATALAGSATAPAQPPAASSANIAVTPAFLYGRWTDDGDCSNAIDFLADGRFVTTGGGAGRWSLSGGRLTFQAAQTISARIQASSRNRIVLYHDDGAVGQSTRCSAPPRQTAMPPLPATPQAALAMSSPASRQMLIGRWTDTGDCANIVQFFPDGRFSIHNGAGTWTLDGERLTFRGQSAVTARLRAVGQNRILLIHDNQTIGQSIRC
jgi:hypothetical protein